MSDDRDQPVTHPGTGEEMPVPGSQEGEQYQPIDNLPEAPVPPDIPVTVNTPSPEYVFDDRVGQDYGYSSGDYHDFQPGVRDIEVFRRWVDSINVSAIVNHARYWKRVSELLESASEMLGRRMELLAEAWSGDAATAFLSRVTDARGSLDEWVRAGRNNAAMLDQVVEDVGFARKYLGIFHGHYRQMLETWWSRDGDEMVVYHPEAPGWTAESPVLAPEDTAARVPLMPSGIARLRDGEETYVISGDKASGEVQIKGLYHDTAATVIQLLADQYVDHHYYIDQATRYRGPLDVGDPTPAPPWPWPIGSSPELPAPGSGDAGLVPPAAAFGPTQELDPEGEQPPPPQLTGPSGGVLTGLPGPGTASTGPPAAAAGPAPAPAPAGPSAGPVPYGGPAGVPPTRPVGNLPPAGQRPTVAPGALRPAVPPGAAGRTPPGPGAAPGPVRPGAAPGPVRPPTPPGTAPTAGGGRAAPAGGAGRPAPGRPGQGAAPGAAPGAGRGASPTGPTPLSAPRGTNQPSAGVSPGQRPGVRAGQQPGVRAGQQPATLPGATGRQRPTGPGQGGVGRSGTRAPTGSAGDRRGQRGAPGRPAGERAAGGGTGSGSPRLRGAGGAARPAPPDIPARIVQQAGRMGGPQPVQPALSGTARQGGRSGPDGERRPGRQRGAVAGPSGQGTRSDAAGQRSTADPPEH